VRDRDGEVRQGRVLVLRTDLGRVPHRDGALEDLRERGGREPKVVDAGEIERKHDGSDDQREVEVRPSRACRSEVLCRRSVDAGEIDPVVREVLETARRSDADVVHGHCGMALLERADDGLRVVQLEGRPLAIERRPGERLARAGGGRVRGVVTGGRGAAQQHRHGESTERQARPPHLERPLPARYDPATIVPGLESGIIRAKRRCIELCAVALVVIAGAVAGAPAAVGGTATSPASIFDAAGSGSSTTAAFRLPDQWSLRWSFDCSRSIAGPGIFSVEVVATSSRPRHDAGIPRLLRFGTSGYGIERYARGGHRAFLRIASECAWTVRAARLPS
jgi:hypothetical protein